MRAGGVCRKDPSPGSAVKVKHGSPKTWSLICCCLNSPALVLPFLWTSSFACCLGTPLAPHVPHALQVLLPGVLRALCCMVAPTWAPRTWLEELDSDAPTVQCVCPLMSWGHRVLANLPGLLGTAQLGDPLETGRFFGSSRCTQDMVFSGGHGLF